MAEVKILGSGRHIHLSEKDFNILFDDGELVSVRELGAGQFQAQQKVKLIFPRGEFQSVTILGPFRNETQVEISLTDAAMMGVEPMIRMSGDLDNTPGCRIVGTKGEIEINQGVIVAKRHIHFNPEEAKLAGIKDGEEVYVLAGKKRQLFFGQVTARVSDKDKTTVMHIDYDEMNAAGIGKEETGEVYSSKQFESFFKTKK